jgi:radical SAM protein with 4Fe4S-binding SPASM domain
MTDVKALIKDSKHFCVLPWIHFHSWPNGNVMPCCIADSEKPVGKIKSDESIIEMMNSEDFKRLRRDMLEDKPSDECKRCYDLELLGTWTMRQSHNKRRGFEYIDMIEATNPDGSIDNFEMRYMDIRFSNLCNMKCRSCGPACSSQWAEEYVKKPDGAEKLQKFFGMKTIVVNSNEDQKFMTKLKPYLKDVTEVYFAGGEVIITPEHYECLNYWIDNKLTDQVELTYTTNFSVLKYKDKDLIKLWKKFPNIKIWASLDASGDIAEVIRKGTKWNNIIKNVSKLKKEVPHAEFQITPTISIWNIFTFADFFDNMVEEGILDLNNTKWHSGIRFNLLSYPWYANIMILPDHIKDKLIDRYRKSVIKYDHNEHVRNGFKMIIYSLKHGESNKGGLLEFMKSNDEMDEHRKEKLLDVIPELKEVYEWANS